MLADCIASAINKMDWLSAAQLTKSDIETYVDLNPALEEDGKTLMCKCLLYLILLFYFYSLASSISGIEDFGIGFYKPFLFFYISDEHARVPQNVQPIWVDIKGVVGNPSVSE